MRELTFKGFLTRYVKELSKANTLKMKVLAEEAAADNVRLRAPLVLYAVVSEKTSGLAQLFGASEAAAELDAMRRLLSEDCVEKVLLSADLPEEYRKVWAAYLVAKAAPDRDRALKEAVRKKVLSLQSSRKCSNYRIYTDLKLNPGNVNNWLKHGNSEKVSCRTAERIMDYVLNYPTRV